MLLCLAMTFLPAIALARVVDLTHTYGPDVLYPPIGPNGTADMFNFTIMHRGIEPGLNHWLEINWFGVFEHGSTHIDAPAHYHQGGRHVNEIPPDQLLGPGVNIDIRKQMTGSRDYLMTVEDIKNWEAENGEIPTGAIVMMNTGRHKAYPNRKLFYDTETPEIFSSVHNPGIDRMAARWLVQNRQIKAFGTDCHSPDPGQNNNENPAHDEFLPNNVVILEFVAHLDLLPATGAQIMYAPIKMRDGSGGPCRVLAILDDGDTSTNEAVVTRGLFTVLFSSVLIVICLL